MSGKFPYYFLQGLPTHENAPLLCLSKCTHTHTKETTETKKKPMPHTQPEPGLPGGQSIVALLVETHSSRFLEFVPPPRLDIR